MNAIKKIGIAVAVAVALAANLASAAPGGKFVAADGNRDGALTKSEACVGKTRHICKKFEMMDVNKDGVVTRAEAKGFRNAKRVAKGLPPRA
jgi:EF hand